MDRVSWLPRTFKVTTKGSYPLLRLLSSLGKGSLNVMDDVIRFSSTNPHNVGGMMKIKFDRFEAGQTKPNASGKTFNVIRVFGTALEGKTKDLEWSTQFFANSKELADTVKGFVKGDFLNVRMKQNGQYWNVTGFDKIDEPTPEKSSTTAPPANPRLNNLKVAIEVLGPKAPKREPAEYMIEAASVADLVDNYVNKTGAFQFNNSVETEVPDVNDDLV